MSDTHAPLVEPRVAALIEACEFAAGAILDAISDDDGLDGAAGAAVLRMLRKALADVGRPLFDGAWPPPEDAHVSYPRLEDELVRLRSALTRAISIASIQTWTDDDELLAEMNALAALAPPSVASPIASEDERLDAPANGVPTGTDRISASVAENAASRDECDKCAAWCVNHEIGLTHERCKCECHK